METRTWNNQDARKLYETAMQYFKKHPDINKYSRKDSKLRYSVIRPGKGNKRRPIVLMRFIGKGSFGKAKYAEMMRETAQGIIQYRECAVKIIETQRNDNEYLDEIKNLQDAGERVMHMSRRSGPGMKKHYIIMDYKGVSFSNAHVTGRAAYTAICKINSYHHNGFVHSDIKPENLCYDPQKQEASAIDFGLYGQIGGENCGGTEWYTPREAASHFYRNQPERDIYALGKSFEQINTPRSSSSFPYYKQHAFFRQLVKQMQDPNPQKRPSLYAVASLMRSFTPKKVLLPRTESIANNEEKKQANREPIQPDTRLVDNAIVALNNVELRVISPLNRTIISKLQENKLAQKVLAVAQAYLDSNRRKWFKRHGVGSTHMMIRQIAIIIGSNFSSSNKKKLIALQIPKWINGYERYKGSDINPSSRIRFAYDYGLLANYNQNQDTPNEFSQCGQTMKQQIRREIANQARQVRRARRHHSNQNQGIFHPLPLPSESQQQRHKNGRCVEHRDHQSVSTFRT